MEKKINKTKLGELAKDLNVTNADIVKCLETYDGETRKTQASLLPEEVSYVLEYFTQKNQVENFNEYFANNVKTEGEKKPEVKEKKTAKKAAAKAEVVYVNAENAGFRAGDVYQVLAGTDKALTLAEVAKLAKLSVSDTLLGLGWLLKEGKVASTEENKIVLA